MRRSRIHAFRPRVRLKKEARVRRSGPGSVSRFWLIWVSLGLRIAGSPVFYRGLPRLAVPSEPIPLQRVTPC